MGNFRINEFGEAVRTQNGTRKAGAPAPKKKNLADIMKAGRRQANAAKRTAAETQDFLKWALQNCKNQGDLDAIRDLVASNGTAKQRKAFEKLEYDMKKAAEAPKAPVADVPKAPAEGSKKARRAEIAKQREVKLANKENFRQAMLNAESAEDLKALEKEYGKKFTGSLKSTYNARMHALEKAAAQQALQHAEAQTAYDRLFGYGNGKNPSNTQLGNAKATSSSGMTWAKYAQEHGNTYTKPFSDVAHADRLAEEAIARNKQHAEMQKVYEDLFKNVDNNGAKPMEMTPEARATYERVDRQLHKKTPVTPYEYPLSGKSAAESAAVFEQMPPVGEPPAAEPPVSGGNGGKPPVDPPSGNGSGKKPPVDRPSGNGGKTKGPKGKGFKMPKIGKKGKFALAALVLGSLGAGIAYLTKSKKAAPTTPSGEPIKPGFVMTDSIKKEKVDTIPATPIINPIVDEKPVVQTDRIEQQVVAEIPRDAESGKYIVRKGDNCWNIAKAELIKENGGEIPTDKEVMERTYKILERNDLHYEADKYTVLIYPNDTLNIKM